MGAVSSLRQFFARPEPLVTQLGNPFLHLDMEVAARDLRLEERGTENGLLDLPSTSANLDPVEREIVDRVVGVARQAEQEVAAQFQAYDERISGLGLLAQIPVIAVASTQAVGEMKAAVAKANLRLTTARENVSQSYEQLRAFRHAHAMRRLAKLDTPFMATTGAIVLTWVGETALNSFLLRQNDDMGLLGGIIAAAAVGAINIGTAAFVGRIVWPLINLRAVLPRSFGIGVTGLWAILTLVWNLLAAHYRDAKVAGLLTPESAALRMFGSVAPDSIYSWGLFILGIIFSVIAARSAYRMDDPYPGYGAVSREHNSRCEDYAAEVGDATEELSDIRGEAVDEISDVRRELAKQLADRDRALNGRNAFVQRYVRFHAELESAVNQLLAIYRNANRRARSTPAPDHFEKAFRLPPLEVPPAPQLQITAEHVAKADTTLMEAVEKMSAAYLDGIHRFETLESLNAKLSHG